MQASPNFFVKKCLNCKAHCILYLFSSLILFHCQVLLRFTQLIHTCITWPSHDPGTIITWPSHDPGTIITWPTVSCDIEFTCSKLLVAVLNHAQMTRNLYAIESKSMTAVHVCTEAQSMFVVCQHTATTLFSSLWCCGISLISWCKCLMDICTTTYTASLELHTSSHTVCCISHQWQQKTFGGTWQTPLPFLPHSYSNHDVISRVIYFLPWNYGHRKVSETATYFLTSVKWQCLSFTHISSLSGEKNIHAINHTSISRVGS